MRKILVFLVLWLMICGAAIAQDQSVTIAMKDAKVSAILTEISKQTGMDFSYDARKIDAEQLLDFEVTDDSLEETMRVLGKKINIDFELIENQLVLTRIKEKKNRDGEGEYFTLSGFLNDQGSGESLIGATVSVRGTALGAVTNAFGYYSLRLLQGTYRLAFSYVGYELEELEVELKKNEQKDLVLKASTIDLPDVIVALPLRLKLQNRGAGKLSFNPNELSNMPEFGGESGLIKGMQTLPGIKTHSDASAFFYVRGGEKDQNLIIIDDAPIYNPAHLFGFYSMVIPDFAKKIDIYKSDIPTNLGDRLSSIINIRTKDGNLNKWEFSGSLNPLINRFSLEIPVVKKKSSILTSFRRSNFQWLYQRNSPDAKLEFGDFSFKWNQKFNDKNRLFFTIITGADTFLNNADNSNSGITWGNFASTLRWNYIFNPKLFSNTIIYTGNYRYRIGVPGTSWESGIGTLSLKSDFTHFARTNFTAKFGFELLRHYFNPGKLYTEESNSIFPEITSNFSNKSILYYQANVDLTDKWHLSAGLRASLWSNIGPTTYYEFSTDYQVQDTIVQGEGIYQNYANIDPRLSIDYQLDTTSMFKLSWGVYHQYMQLISNSVSPFTSLEVWLPSGPNIRPQSANQVALNYTKFLSKSNLVLSCAAYYKKLKHQIDYESHANTLLNPLVDAELRFGEMQTYGLEILLKKEVGKLNGWISYNWSRAIRQTAEINGGRNYPAFQDRPHDFSLLLNYQMRRRILFSAYWTSYSGSTFSSPTGFYEFNNQQVPVFQNKNNDRLPGYRRFDFAFKFTLNKKPESRYQHSLTFSVYNAFAHKNIVAVNFNKVLNAEDKPEVQSNFINERELIASQRDYIRFFPSLTYKFKL